MNKLFKTSLAALLALGLAACGSSDAASTTESPAPDNTAAADGGADASDAAGSDTLTVALGGQFTTFDPALNSETINSNVLSHIYSSLTALDNEGKVIPDLAETWETSEDGLTWTFHLRDGITYSDGTPITADDFVFGALRSLSYGVDNSWMIDDLCNYVVGANDYRNAALEAGEGFDCTVEDASTVGYKAVDDKTIEISLIMPCAFLDRLLTGGTVYTPLPATTPQHTSLWAFETTDYVTTGAYTLVEVNETEKAIVKKNPNYWNADSVLMENIEFLCMPDADAKMLAFQKGEVDVASAIALDAAAQYVGTDQLWMQPISCNYYLAINSGETGPEWAKDARVRKALALAIDRTVVSQSIGLGSTDFYPPLNGLVPHGFSTPDGTDFREKADASGYALDYDPAAAKELLAEAGYDESNPLEITLKYGNNGVHADVATVLMGMWSAVGVNVKPNQVESGVYYDQLDGGDFEIGRYGWSASSSPISFLEVWTSSKQVTAAVDDPAYDQMIADIRNIADANEYYAALEAAEKYLIDENVYAIPMMEWYDATIVQDNISGHRMAGVDPYYGEVVKN